MPDWYARADLHGHAAAAHPAVEPGLCCATTMHNVGRPADPSRLVICGWVD
jgi:hypothetical protein